MLGTARHGTGHRPVALIPGGIGGVWGAGTVAGAQQGAGAGM